MEIELQYGKKGLSVHLPELCTPTIIKKPKMPILSDHKSAIDKALTNPINSQPLAELSKKSKSACIVICDITRPVPNHLFLRPIIDIMISSGIKKENICILVATGLHRPNEGEELRELINDDWVLDNISISNHNARDENQHVNLGFTATRNTPIKINKKVTIQRNFPFFQG